jgi:hypothetical protein
MASNPLDLIAIDDPITCSCSSMDNGLPLKWITKDNKEKKLAVNKASTGKHKYYPFWIFGVLVP